MNSYSLVIDKFIQFGPLLRNDFKRSADQVRWIERRSRALGTQIKNQVAAQTLDEFSLLRDVTVD
jgi:hypothetical protein